MTARNQTLLASMMSGCRDAAVEYEIDLATKKSGSGCARPAAGSRSSRPALLADIDFSFRCRGALRSRPSTTTISNRWTPERTDWTITLELGDVARFNVVAWNQRPQDGATADIEAVSRLRNDAVKLAVLSDLHLEISPWGAGTHPAGSGCDRPRGRHRHDDARPSWARRSFPGKRVCYVAGNHGPMAADLRPHQRNAPGCRELYIDFMEKTKSCSMASVFSAPPCGRISNCSAPARRWASPCRKPANAYRFRRPHPLLADAELPSGGSIALHRQSRDWLAAKLDEPFDGKTVVVTHHAPSMRSIAARYAEDPVSAAFGSNLNDLVAKANLWIHGHTHTAFRYQIGGRIPSRGVVCNPRLPGETYAGVQAKTGWHRACSSIPNGW